MFLVILMLSFVVMACSNSGEVDGDVETPAPGEENKTNENEAAEGDNEDQGTRTVSTIHGDIEVPVNPQRVVVLTGDALEAVLSVGLIPVGSVEAMGDTEWYEHLLEYMDGVVNVGAMGTPDLEAIQQLAPDLILGTNSRQEESYELLQAIAPTVFTESHTLGQWKTDFRLYVDAVNKLDEGEQALADWEERAAELSTKLDAAGKLEQEVGILRFTAGQGRFFYNMSYSGSIVKELGFARPANHDIDDQWVENITQERIPEMNADILFYFVLESGDGEATKFADEWIETQLFQDLRAAQNEQLYEVEDGYWNMTYGIISADYVLEDIERLVLGQ